MLGVSLNALAHNLARGGIYLLITYLPSARPSTLKVGSIRCSSFSFGTRRSDSSHCKYALTALIRLLQLDAFSPFSRIRMTKAFRSDCLGLGLPSHLNDSLYHSMVRGETFCKYRRSLMNCSNIESSKAGLLWRCVA